ncbi:MAG: Uncharacterized protein LiPW39_286 [Parcubacteria group bacterium LiPW_39]|nr:MAG: Uncharacterized protein LiPW39_286 [Parcubacteria group bacterium LiPW_39]
MGLNGQLGLLANLSIEQAGWVAITSIILFGYVMTWYSGLKYVPVSLAAAVLIFGSPITTLLSLISGGAVNAKELAGVGLILTGLTIIFAAEHIIKKIRQLLSKEYVRS